MEIEIALLFNGNCQILDADDEAPLMTISFHNELASIPDTVKMAIGKAAFDRMEDWVKSEIQRKKDKEDKDDPA